MRVARIFRLGIGQIFENLDREKLVSTYSPVQQLILAGSSIEHPSAVLLYKRNWNRPITSTYIKDNTTLIVVFEPMHLIVAPGEFVARIFVRHWISRRQNLIGVRAQYGAEGFQVVRFVGCEQGL